MKQRPVVLPSKCFWPVPTEALYAIARNPVLMPSLVANNKEPKDFEVPAVAEVAFKGKEKGAKWADAWDAVIYGSYASPGVPRDRAAFLEKALRPIPLAKICTSESLTIETNFDHHNTGGCRYGSGTVKSAKRR